MKKIPCLLYVKFSLNLISNLRVFLLVVLFSISFVFAGSVMAENWYEIYRVNIGFENFTDLMITPREADGTTVEALKYAKNIPFKNSKSIKTKFKLISGILPPGLVLPEEITGTKLGVGGTVFDSVDVFKDVFMCFVL